MPLLALFLREAPFSFQASQIALVLGLFAIADRGLSLVWAVFIQRFSYRMCMVLGFSVAGLSLIAISLYHHFYFCIVMMIIFGAGLSFAALASRLWTLSIEDAEERLMGMSEIYRAINLAAGVAPVIAFLLPYQRYALEMIATGGVFQLLAAFVLFFFFRSDLQASEKMFSWKGLIFAFKNHIFTFPILSLYLVFGLSSFSMFQMLIVPYYYKTYYTIPSIIGFVLAINPFAIVFFQKRVSKLFFRMHHRQASLAYFVGLISITLGFIPFIFTSHPLALVALTLGSTFGEMLILGHTDYMLTLRTPKSVHPYILSLTGVVMALGRGVAEGGAIASLSFFTSHGLPPETWWMLNAVLFAAVTVVGMMLVTKRQKLRTTTPLRLEECP